MWSAIPGGVLLLRTLQNNAESYQYLGSYVRMFVQQYVGVTEGTRVL